MRTPRFLSNNPSGIFHLANTGFVDPPLSSAPWMQVGKRDLDAEGKKHLFVCYKERLREYLL